MRLIGSFAEHANARFEIIETTLRDLAEPMVMLSRGVKVAIESKGRNDDRVDDLERRVRALEAKKSPGQSRAVRAAETNAAVDGCTAGMGDDVIQLAAGTCALSTAVIEDDALPQIAVLPHEIRYRLSLAMALAGCPDMSSGRALSVP